MTATNRLLEKDYRFPGYWRCAMRIACQSRNGDITIFVSVRIHVLTAANMKMAVFWYVASCGLVEVYRLAALVMEALSISETSVNFHKSTRPNISDDNKIQNVCRLIILS
jgi:hypothetical protein